MNSRQVMRRIRLSREHAAVLAALLALALLLVPLPATALDVLLTLNLAFALAVLLVALLPEGPLSFGALPGVLVAGSLARVALAIGVARAILATGTGGSVVQSLGMTLTGGGETLLGGVAVFGLLVLTAYGMLNLGLTRLAEVAARFALDALPGRQMALDSALNAGRLEPAAATAQTERLEAENAFYGAMDGAARFLRGETLTILLITVLTPVVAVASGAAAQWRDYALLAIGQGMVILVPGLLVGAAAALVLSRSRAADEAEGLGGLWARPGLLLGVAVVLLAMGLAPGLAQAPLVVMALVLGGLAWHMARRRPAAAAAQQEGELQLRLGLGLVPLSARHDLVAWLDGVRSELSDELGFAVPAPTISDDTRLPTNDFAVLLNGHVITQGTLRVGRRLAVSVDDESHRGAMRARDAEGEVMLPDGRRCLWLRDADAGHLAGSGYRLLEPLAVLALYVQAAVRQVAPELCDLQRAHELLAAVRVSHPAVVAAYQAAGLTAADLQDVGCELLREGLPLTERVSLLGAMAREGKMPAPQLVERIRPALQRTITRLVAPQGMVQTVELASELQQELQEVVATAGMGEQVALPPGRAERWWEMLRWVERWCGDGTTGAVILCEPAIRRAVAQLAREAGTAVAVVHADELLPLTEIQVVHVLQGDEVGVGSEAAAGHARAPGIGGMGLRGGILGLDRRTNPMRRRSERS